MMTVQATGRLSLALLQNVCLIVCLLLNGLVVSVGLTFAGRASVGLVCRAGLAVLVFVTGQARAFSYRCTLCTANREPNCWPMCV